MSGEAIEFQTRKNMSVALRRYTVDIDTTDASYFFLLTSSLPLEPLPHTTAGITRTDDAAESVPDRIDCREDRIPW